MNRDQKVESIRPQLALENINTRPIEKFQNDTLRPILKLQHELTLFLLINHRNYKSLNSSKLEEKEYQHTIKKFIQTNIELKNQLIGVVIGQFMNAELAFYITERKEINKRIIQMQVNRYSDTFNTSYSRK